MASGLLQGLKILDLTHIWAGPLAIRFLADMGADVIKVEAPLSRGPQEYPSTPIGGWLGGEPSDEPWNRNAMVAKLMRNRRSLAIDLKTDQGREVFLKLVAQADVVVENFSARAMHNLRLGYPVLKQANPQIVYIQMPGFGITGPLCDRVAFGPTVEVMSGFTQMMGYGPDHLMNTGMALLDPITATNAASAILQGLRQRDQSNKSVHIEMSLHEGGVSYNGPWLVQQQLTPDSLECIGNRHPQMVPHGVFACLGEDQWVAIACANDGQWVRLCTVIPGLDANLDQAARRAQEDEIEAVIRAWCKDQHKLDVVHALQNGGVAAGSVNNVAEMVADEQTQSRGFFVEYEPSDTPMPGNPMHMSQMQPDTWKPYAKLGEHNQEVLSEWLGMDGESVQKLHQAGVIVDKPPA